MGAKDILAYLDRETMGARRFLGLWLEEFPTDDLHDAALVLARIVEADRGCIRVRDLDPSLDVWDEDVYAERTGLQSSLVDRLRKIASERGGIDEVPDVPLSRDALAEASQSLRLPVARFLLPPRFAPPSVPTGQPSSEGRTNSTEPECEYGEGFRTVVWHGNAYVFTLQQGRAVEQLWRAWEKGLGLSQKDIGESIESTSDNFRLRDLFRDKGSAGRMHPAWNTMIKEIGKGMYALYPPRNQASDS